MKTKTTPPIGFLAWVAENQVIAGVLAICAASVAPLTAYVSAQNTLALEKAKAEAQLKLEQEREKNTRNKEQRTQDHEIRMAYFSKAIDPALDDRERERVLRFLANSFADKDLREWAANELKGVQKTIADLEHQRANAEAKRAALQLELVGAKTALDRAAVRERQNNLDRADLLEKVARERGVLSSKVALCSSMRLACSGCERREPSCNEMCMKAIDCEFDVMIALKPSATGGIRIPGPSR